MAPLSPEIIRAEITPGKVRINSSARLIGSTLPAIGEDTLGSLPELLYVDNYGTQYGDKYFV